MAVKATRFVADLRRFAVIGIDSMVPIYHLEDAVPYAELTEEAFAAVAAGTPRAVLSTVSVAEVLVKPFAEGRTDRVQTVDRFFRSFPNSVRVAPGYEAAKDAARLRATYRLRAPDALIVATARSERAEAIVTNDKGLRPLRSEGLGIVVLDDYL